MNPDARADWSSALRRAASLVVRVDVPEVGGGLVVGSGLAHGDGSVSVLGLLVARVALGEVWVYSGRRYAGEVNVWGAHLAAALISVPGLTAGGPCDPRWSRDLAPREPMIAISATEESFETSPGYLHAVLPNGIPGERWRKSLLLCTFEGDQPLCNAVVVDRDGRFLGFVAHEAPDWEHMIVVPAEHIFDPRD